MSTEKLALFGGPKAVTLEHERWPVITGDDKAQVLAAVERVLDRRVLSGHFAPEVRALEKEFAEWLGVRYAMATNSGTSALHCALGAAGIGPGDEVITSAFSFVATAMAILQQNAIPVFVDIEPVSFGLDPQLVEAAITPRTRAIMPVHIHGLACDLKPILEIAKRHGLRVIEDAAQAHGATLDGQKVGTFGELAAFSLQSSKNLACGEGGLCVTNDEELYRRAMSTRMFGEDVRPSDEAEYRIERALDGNRAYDSRGIGWMYRTNELSAAVARTQLRSLDGHNETGSRNAELLSQRLRDLPGVTPPRVPAGRVSIYHKYRVQLNGERAGVRASPLAIRELVRKALCAEGVEAVLWQTKPVPGQSLFQDKVGFGRSADHPSGPGCPWDHGRDVSYDLRQYPETVKLLEGSVCLFSHTCPIFAQPLRVAEQYADAFTKVWNALPELVRRGEEILGLPEILKLGVTKLLQDAPTLTKDRALELIRSPWGRVAGLALGLTAVTLLVLREGPEKVWSGARAAAVFLPLIAAFELTMVACDVLAIWALYGFDRRLPARLLARAGFLGYSVMSMMPVGRTAAEASRAALFSPRVGTARATVVAVQIQGAALAANAAISVVCAAFAATLGHARPLAAAVLLNGAVTSVGAAVLLVGGRVVKVGGFLGRLIPKARDFGHAFDRETAETSRHLGTAVLFECLARAVQVVENGVLVAVVGGVSWGFSGFRPAMLSEAIHLVGVTLGDLIPAQLGGTESQFALLGGALGLHTSAVSIGIVAHAGQLCALLVSLLALAILSGPHGKGMASAPAEAA